MISAPSPDPSGRPRSLPGSLPIVETTFQLLVELEGDPQAAYAQAIDLCLRYCESKLGALVAEGEHPPFGFVMTDIPGQSLEVAALPEEGIWAARCMYPDSPLPPPMPLAQEEDARNRTFARKGSVPGRTWVTEVSLRRLEHHCRLGLCVRCASQPYAYENIFLLRPALVGSLHRTVGLRGQRRLLDQPWMLETEAELAELSALLCNPRRSVLVHVLAEHADGSGWLVSPERVAQRTLSIAHVVALPARLLSAWNETVGEPFGLLPGAVRSYRPEPSGELEQPTDHPLIAGYLRLEPPGKEQSTIKRLLIEQAFRYAADRRVDWGDCLFYPEARLHVLEKRRRETHDMQTMQSLYEEANEHLVRRIDELTIDAHKLGQSADEAKADHRQAAQEALNLAARVQALEAALARRKAGEPAPLVFPNQWEGMEAWAFEHLAGQLLLHSRASQGIKNAEYLDPELAYRALHLLATEYRDMKLGVDGALERYQVGLGRLGLQDDPATKPTQAGRKGDTMYVEYPPGSRRRVLLQMHLKKGVDRDPRNLLRIYYFWDGDAQLVVVGWLPSHL